MAQLGARLDGIEEVVGSNPIGSTKISFSLFLCALSGEIFAQSLMGADDRKCAKKARCSRVSDRPRNTIAPTVLDASASAIRTKRQPDFFSTAICGIIETPIPAPTMLKMLLNCPLSKTICGCSLARSQAATAVSRKQ